MEFNKICRSDFDKMCRTCLKIDENVLDCSTLLFEKLHYSIGLKLEEDSELPHVFCNSCKDNINIMYDFKRLCLYSQQLLADAIKDKSSNQSNNTHKDINVKIEETFENSSVNKISNLNPTGIYEDVKENLDKQGSPDNLSIDNKIELSNENFIVDNISEHSYKNDSEIDDNSIPLQNKSSISCRDEELSDHNSISNESMPTKLTSLMTSKTIKVADTDTYKRLEYNNENNYSLNKISNLNPTGIYEDVKENLDKQGSPDNSSIDNKIELYNKNFIVDKISEHSFKNDSEIDDNSIPLQNKSLISCRDEELSDSNSISNESISTKLASLMTSKTIKLPDADAYKCLECEKICKTRGNMKEHMLLHIPKEYRLKYCTICDKTYTRTDTYKKHLKKFHQNTNSQMKKLCTLCGKSFSQLTQHMLRVHSQNKPYNCSTCDSKFSVEIALNEHISKVHNRKKYIKILLCPECGRTFKCRRDLESHVANHTGQKPFKCTLCKLDFKWPSGLEYHLKTKHSLQPEKTPKDNTPCVKELCQLCGRSFTNLRDHTLRIHSENKPYSCSKCDNKFSYKGYLNGHVNRVHNGIVKPKKKLLCPECGKTFSCPLDLDSHIAFHAGIKLHKCTLCNREFTFRHRLTKHMKEHQGIRVKNFACTYCDKKFGSNSILRNHIRTHTGERPFSCKICQKSFTQESTLTTHMKIHKIQK